MLAFRPNTDTDDHEEPANPSTTRVAPARATADALLSALTRKHPQPYPLIPWETCVAQWRDGQPGALQWVFAHAHRQSIDARVAATLAWDQQSVTLADGSTLTRDEGERRLAEKESVRPFLPLRQAIDDSGLASLKAWEAGSRAFAHQLAEAGVSPTRDVPDMTSAESSLVALLKHTRDACEASIQLLEEYSDAPIRTWAEFARAWDWPDATGAFSHEGARHFALALRDASATRAQRALRRVQAPRVAAGHLVSACSGPLRVWVAPARRARRTLDLLDGFSSALTCALLPEHALEARSEEALRCAGSAFSLAALSPTLRRTLFGESSDQAERAARIGRAVWLLRFRWNAIVARAWLRSSTLGAEVAPDEPHPDPSQATPVWERSAELFPEILAEEARAALRVAPEPRSLETRLAALAPWPGGHTLQSRTVQEGRAALRSAWACALYLRLREQYDEAFPLVARPWEILADAGPALREGVLDVAGLFDLTAPEQALAEWCTELM